MTIPEPSWYANGEEASGDLTDSTGNQVDFTDMNTVGSGTGLVSGSSGARDFEASTFERFRVAKASVPDFYPHGHEHWYACAWVNLETVPTSHVSALSGWDAIFQLYSCDIDSAGKPRVRIRDGSLAIQTATWGTALSASTTYFLEWWHDPDADEVGVCVDRGTDVTTSVTGGMHATQESTWIVVGQEQGGNKYLDGRLSPVGFWNDSALSSTAMTSGQRDELYNSGSGVLYPFSSAPAGTPVHYHRRMRA